MSFLFDKIKIIFCIALITFSVQSWSEIIVIAETGQPAADFPEGFIYWDVDGSNAAIGSSGHVAFSGVADTSIGSTENNTNAVWTGLPGQLKAIIKENESPVGFPDNVLFSGGGAPIVSRSGHVGFSAGLKGATQGQNSFDQAALLAYVNGQTLGVIKVGDPAPGFPPGTFIKNIGNYYFSDAGMVFIGTVEGTQIDDFVIWFYDFNQIIQLPTPVVGCSVFPLPIFSLHINDSGEIFLSSLLIGDDNEACPASPGGIFKWDNGRWETILNADLPLSQNGDLVPEMLNTKFETANLLAANNNGNIIFTTNLRDSSNQAKIGIWTINNSNETKLLVLAEETLQGDPNSIILSPSGIGITKNNFSIVPVVLTTQERALLAGIPKVNQPYSSLNETGESQLSIVAHQNQNPPGFESTWFFSEFLAQMLNQNNQFVVTSRVSDAATSDHAIAIWRGKDDEKLRLKAIQDMKVIVDGEERFLEQIGLGTEVSPFANIFFPTKGSFNRIDNYGNYLFDGALSGSFKGLYLLLDDNREQRIFELAEQLYPQFFAPSNVDDRLLEGFEYRFYPDTNTYIGIRNGDVFVLGNPFGPGVQRIGTIDETLQLLENMTGS